jgi:release factor glutamine methyltransferase
VTDPYYSARALLSWTLQLEWEAGYRDLDQDAFLQDCTLTEEGGREYFGYIQRRLNHEPIQYILGQWDFLDYTLRIRPPLLCPRPETEELVELILDDIDPDQRLTTPTQLTNIIISDHHDENKDAPNMPSMRILDVGCGTGCIGIALADRILYSLVDAIDIDPVAIETSTENANCILGESKPRVDCLYRNKKLWIKQNNVANQYDREYVHPQAEKERYLAILSSIQDYHPPYRYDLVVSNPPYIPQSDMPSLDPTVAQHESYHALCGGGPDGMDVIRSLVRKLPQWCVPGGICWIECDPSHPPILQTWLENNNNNEDDLRVRFVQMERDMFGLLRFVKLQVV